MKEIGASVYGDLAKSVINTLCTTTFNIPECCYGAYSNMLHGELQDICNGPTQWDLELLDYKLNMSSI
jgi:hypothetical protein